MVDQIAVVDFTTPGPADPASLDITSPEITETVKAIILIWGNSTNDDENEGGGRCGMAIRALESLSAEETGGALAPLLRNGLTTPTVAVGGGDTAAVILCTNGGSGFDIISTISAVIAGGVTLNFSTKAVSVKGKAIILAGSAMRAWGGSLSVSSTTPVQEDTGPGGSLFQPDLIVCLPTVENVDTTQRSANAFLGIGGAVAGTVQKCGYTDWDNLTEPSDADGVMRSARCAAGLSGAGRVEVGMVVTINSTGFTYAGATATTTRMRYIAVKFGGAFKVGVANFAVSGSTGNQPFSFGFTPAVVFGASFLLTSEDILTDGATAAGAGYFITGTKGSRAVSIRHEEGASSSSHDPSSRQGNHAVLTLDELGNVAQQASWAGTTPGGFVLDFSTATAGMLTAIGIQLAPAPAVARDQRAAAKRAIHARPQKRIPAGVKRASRYGRMLRAVRRNRFLQWLRLLRPSPGTPPTVVPVQSDPGLVRGDNALACSRKGGNALASSTLGDTL